MKRFFYARKGASLVEYSALVGLISVLAITSIYSLGEKTKSGFNVSTMTLDWYVGGVTDDYAARYQFTAAENPGNSEYIGVDLDGVSGTPFGSIDQASFEGLDLRTLQYDTTSGDLQVYLAGDTETLTDGLSMNCVDLSAGETAFVFNFDVNPGFYLGAINATAYEDTSATAPFSVGQELSCVIQ